MPNVAVVYRCGYGHTKVLAEAVARGAASVDSAKVLLRKSPSGGRERYTRAPEQAVNHRLGLSLVPDDRGLTLKPGCTHAYRDLSKGRLDMNAITTKDGVEIFYKDWGKGQPIVFSHGWPLSADDWDTQMLFFLGKGFRVIAHDRRGHGRSTQNSMVITGPVRNPRKG